MNYCPVLVNLSGQKCVVIGGGSVALRKIDTLLQYGADITVISVELCEALRTLGKVVNLKETHYRKGYLKDAFLVVAATSDEALNQTIAHDARAAGCLVNCVDNAKISSIIIPTGYKEGEAKEAIGGELPKFERKISRSFHISQYSKRLSILGKYRLLALKHNKRAIFDSYISEDLITMHDDDKFEQELQKILDKINRE